MKFLNGVHLEEGYQRKFSIRKYKKEILSAGYHYIYANNELTPIAIG